MIYLSKNTPITHTVISTKIHLIEDTKIIQNKFKKLRTEY